MGSIELDGAATARIQRKIVAGPLVIGRHAEGILEQVPGELVVVSDDAVRGLPRRQAGDLAGRVHVAVHQGGRDGEDVGDIVEAIAGIVDGQILAHIDIQGEKIANRIGVFRAVHAPKRGAAGIGIGFAQPVERGFQPVGEIGKLFLGRPFHAARGHLAQTDAAQDFFPGGIVDVEIIRLQRQHGHAGGLHLVVVATRAVLDQHLLAIGRGGSGLGNRQGGGGGSRGGCRHGFGGSGTQQLQADHARKGDDAGRGENSSRYAPFSHWRHSFSCLQRNRRLSHLGAALSKKRGQI